MGGVLQAAEREGAGPAGTRLLQGVLLPVPCEKAAPAEEGPGAKTHFKHGRECFAEGRMKEISIY